MRPLAHVRELGFGQATPLAGTLARHASGPDRRGRAALSLARLG